MRRSTPVVCVIAIAFLFAACSGKVEQADNDSPRNQEIVAAEESNKSEDVADVSQDEFSVHALLAFKKGATKTFRTQLEKIPNGPPLPDVFSSPDAVYHFFSEATYSGAVATAQVSAASADEFKNLRFLWLTSDDLYPSGYAWKDCTVEDPKIGKEFLPNEGERKLSCHFENSQGTFDYYFVVARRTGELRQAPLTSFKFVAEAAPRSVGEDQIRYLLKVTNTGSTDVGEVNFGSTFQRNVRLVDVRPQSGKCQGARYGDSESSVVCYLGTLKAGESTTVEFVAGPGREGKPADLDKKDFNKQWVIRGFSRKTPADMVANGDVFTFEPLKNR